MKMLLVRYNKNGETSFKTLRLPKEGQIQFEVIETIDDDDEIMVSLDKNKIKQRIIYPTDIVVT